MRLRDADTHEKKNRQANLQLVDFTFDIFESHGYCMSVLCFLSCVTYHYVEYKPLFGSLK